MNYQEPIKFLIYMYNGQAQQWDLSDNGEHKFTKCTKCFCLMLDVYLI